MTFTPKLAVLLLFAGVGIVPLARLVVSVSPLRWPARAAVAFLAVALVSALVSPSPSIGFFGLYLWGTGWLFWLGAAGAFAIGASLGAPDRRLLIAGLLVGALGNALCGLPGRPERLVTRFGPLQRQPGGRPSGQPDSPGGTPSRALALVLGRVCRSPLRWGAVVLLLAVGLEFTFERLAIPVLVLLVLYAVYAYGLRRGGAFGLLVAVGYGIVYLGGGSGLRSRVSSGTGETTFGLRLRVWLQSAHYVLHHPLLGVGPGQLRTAMDSSATLSFFQRVLVGRVLTDAHDIFVEVAVTTGLVGLACFLVWLFGAARIVGRSSSPRLRRGNDRRRIKRTDQRCDPSPRFLALGAATAVRWRPEEVCKPVSSAGAMDVEPKSPPGSSTDVGRLPMPWSRTSSRSLWPLFLG